MQIVSKEFMHEKQVFLKNVCNCSAGFNELMAVTITRCLSAKQQSLISQSTMAIKNPSKVPTASITCMMNKSFTGLQ